MDEAALYCVSLPPTVPLRTLTAALSHTQSDLEVFTDHVGVDVLDISHSCSDTRRVFCVIKVSFHFNLEPALIEPVLVLIFLFMFFSFYSKFVL